MKPRVIPPELEPFVQQGLVNLVATGMRVISEDGNDMSPAIMEHAEEVGLSYAVALARYRSATAAPESVEDAHERSRREAGQRRVTRL